MVILEMAADMQKNIPEKLNNTQTAKSSMAAGQLTAQLSLSDLLSILAGLKTDLIEKLEASESLKKHGICSFIAVMGMTKKKYCFLFSTANRKRIYYDSARLV